MPLPPLLPPGSNARTLRAAGWTPAWSLPAARLGGSWSDATAVAYASHARCWLPPPIAAVAARIAPPMPDRPDGDHKVPEPHWFEAQLAANAPHLLPDLIWSPAILWSRDDVARRRSARRRFGGVDDDPAAPLQPSDGHWRSERVALYLDQPTPIRRTLAVLSRQRVLEYARSWDDAYFIRG